MTYRRRNSVRCCYNTAIPVIILHLSIVAKQGKSEGFDSCDRPSNLTQIQIQIADFSPVWPWNLMDEPEINKARFLYYIKLCVSFQIHQWIQTGVTVRKRPIWVKCDDFLSRVTLQFDVWPWKTIGHLWYATSSFVHHFVAIGELKPELHSGNAQSGSNSKIFRAVWPWYLMDDLEKQYDTSAKQHQAI